MLRITIYRDKCAKVTIPNSRIRCILVLLYIQVFFFHISKGLRLSLVRMLMFFLFLFINVLRQPSIKIMKRKIENMLNNHYKKKLKLAMNFIAKSFVANKIS